MTRDEMDILRDIARSLERIADHMTGEQMKEISISELCPNCYYKDHPDICRDRQFNSRHHGGICYSKEREVWKPPYQKD